MSEPPAAVSRGIQRNGKKTPEAWKVSIIIIRVFVSAIAINDTVLSSLAQPRRQSYNKCYDGRHHSESNNKSTPDSKIQTIQISRNTPGEPHNFFFIRFKKSVDLHRVVMMLARGGDCACRSKERKSDTKKRAR